MNKKIPKTIHQIWFQGIETIREPYKFCHESIKKGIFNTDWKLKVWDENTIINLINTYYPQYKKIYDSYNLMIMKIDLAKYIILYHEGGVYIDMDMEWIRDFYNLIENNDELIISHTKYFVYNNGVIFSKPKCKFWELYLNDLLNKLNKKWYEYDTFYTCRTTGPINFTKNIKKYMKNNKVKLIEFEYFESSESQFNIEITNKSVMRNHLANSWINNFDRIIIYIYIKRKHIYITCILLIIIYIFYQIND
jgi:mannosyltransferase OCH1-like enzyme